jgi:hypothetical protein
MDCRPLRDGLCVTGGTFTKKISTSPTLNTPNRHLSAVTILNPTHPPPQPRPAFACQKGIPIPPQTRSAGRTVPHIFSQNPVEAFDDDADEEPAPPATSQNPHLGPHLLPLHIQPTHGCRLATAHVDGRRKPRKPLRQAPHSLVGNRYRHPPTRVTYHAYHAPFSSAGDKRNLKCNLEVSGTGGAGEPVTKWR